MQTAVPDLQVYNALHLVVVLLRSHSDAGWCLGCLVGDSQLLEMCRWYLLLIRVQGRDTAMYEGDECMQGGAGGGRASQGRAGGSPEQLAR